MGTTTTMASTATVSQRTGSCQRLAARSTAIGDPQTQLLVSRVGGVLVVGVRPPDLPEEIGADRHGDDEHHVEAIQGADDVPAHLQGVTDEREVHVDQYGEEASGGEDDRTPASGQRGGGGESPGCDEKPSQEPVGRVGSADLEGIALREPVHDAVTVVR